MVRFFKGLRKASSKQRKFTEDQDPALFPPNPTGKRPKGFKMPEWAQKDYFQEKDMGTMVPPEELAEEASLRRPTDWLRKKIKGTDRVQQFENIKKTRFDRSGPVGMSDQEIDDFLGEVLKKSGRKKGKRSSKRAPRKGKPGR
ncbi:MAG: hypothetical protein R3257_07145 [bacterium]|nr:hypothetical protein [bacterium]